MLDDDWLGRRVVVRRSLGTGASGRPTYSDALGDLIELTADQVVIDTHAGRVQVSRAEIATARLVKPSPADQLALEATAARGWRAAVLETNADGWLLRADGGWTGRANSALPLRTLNRPLDDTLAEITQWYRVRDLPPMIQVPLPTHANLDRALNERGWTYPEDVHVLAARLDLMRAALLRQAVPLATSVSGRPEPDPGWLDSYHYRGGALPPNAAALLARHDRPRFVTARAEAGPEAAIGEIMGIARGVVDDSWLGITALEVRPAHRRHGVAGVVVLALTEWAIGLGATYAYLQVSADNAPGLAFYDRLGFFEHHSYRYRVPPTIDP